MSLWEELWVGLKIIVNLLFMYAFLRSHDGYILLNSGMATVCFILVIIDLEYHFNN